MKWQHCLGLPHDFGRSFGCENFENSLIGEMTATCSGKRSIQYHLVAHGTTACAIHKFLGSLARTHGMRAARAKTYLV